MALAESTQTAFALTEQDRLGLYRFMRLTREVEERGDLLYRQGKIPGSFYSGRGQEATAVGAAFALAAGDPISSPLIRDLGAHLVRGTELDEIFKHYMGRENKLSRGREGNVHFGDRRRGIVGMVSMLPDMMVVSLGLATAFKLRRERRCALSFFGEGATSSGDWHEAMNWAAIDALPLVFILEDNQYAYSTPHSKQFAVHPIERASGYGVMSAEVDGNDVEQVFTEVARAREQAISGEGPTLICAKTMRMQGHGAHDDASYVDPALREYWKSRDPLDLQHKRLEDAGLGDELDEIDKETAELVAEAVERALEAPLPEPVAALEDVFCAGEPEVLGQEGDAPWSGFSEAAD